MGFDAKGAAVMVGAINAPFAAASTLGIILESQTQDSRLKTLGKFLQMSMMTCLSFVFIRSPRLFTGVIFLSPLLSHGMNQLAKNTSSQCLKSILKISDGIFNAAIKTLNLAFLALGAAATFGASVPLTAGYVSLLGISSYYTFKPLFVESKNP